MTSRAVYGALFLAFALAACGGGGGGSTTPQPSSTATPEPSVQGDMLALAPSRGWNYQATYQGQSLTVSLYADPTPTNNVHGVIVAGVLGLVPTVLTSASNVDANLVGAIGFTDTNETYNAVSELSAGSTAAIPGNPLFVPSKLTLGQTWGASGGTATVTLIGNVPNANVCPSPVTGASVRYTYPGFDETISFVPGCGITDELNNSNGADFKLVSVNTYTSLGELSESRRVASLTLMDTARSLIGLGRNVAPGSHAVAPLFAHR